MNSFKIGNTEFGVGSVNYSLENNVLNLEILGDKETFNELCKDDDFEFCWALYAPKIYFRDIPFNGSEIEIDDSMLNEYEIALYLMEHNDFWGKVRILDDTIEIAGKVDLSGEIETVSISIETSM